MGTIVTALVILVGIILAIYSIYKDKKAGKSTCGGSCSGCASSSLCHSDIYKEYKKKEKK